MKTLRKNFPVLVLVAMLAVALPLAWAQTDKGESTPIIDGEKIHQLDSLKKAQFPDAKLAGVYGSDKAIGVKAYDAAAIAADIEQFDGKMVAVSGEIRDVCAKKGCWMNLNAGDDHPPVFVRFQDYAFFVPRNAAGHQATLVGRASKTEISEDMAKHFLEDAGASAEEIAKVKGPQETIQVMAVSVAIDQPAKLDPPFGSSAAKKGSTTQPSSRPAATTQPSSRPTKG